MDRDRLRELFGDRATGANVMDEKVEQFTKWAHDVMDETRRRLLAGTRSDDRSQS